MSILWYNVGENICMKKGIINDVTNNDGRPVVEITCLADIDKLKEYKEKKIDVRIVMHPKTCTDPYPKLVEAMTNLLGDPEKIALATTKKEVKN